MQLECKKGFEVQTWNVLQMEESQENKVVLREVDLTATGQYKCEVGRDWPDFTFDDKTANMTVVGELIDQLMLLMKYEGKEMCFCLSLSFEASGGGVVSKCSCLNLMYYCMQFFDTEMLLSLCLCTY